VLKANNSLPTVLGAHPVGVGERRLVVGRAGGKHLAVGRDHADAEGGGGDVDHHLRPRVAPPPHRAVRRPDVLADLDRQQAEVESEDVVAQRHAAGIEGEPGGTAREGARLVEDVVGGELLLGHEAEDLAAVDHRGTVEDLPADAHADHEHRRQVHRLLGEPLQLGPLSGEERPPLDQVLGRIPAGPLLREAPDRHPRRRHLPRLARIPSTFERTAPTVGLTLPSAILISRMLGLPPGESYRIAAEREKGPAFDSRILLPDHRGRGGTVCARLVSLLA
jgi:hypothetical protein